MHVASLNLGASIGRLMAWAQMRGVERATNGEIRSALRLSPDQVRQLMTRVNRKGMAILLQRGLWLLPPKLPPAGRWTVPPDILLRHLFEAKGGDY